MKDHTIAALKIKEAVEKDGKLVVINDFDSQIDDWANKKICADNNVKILKEILKAIIDLGLEAKNANGFEELKESLIDIKPSEDAKEIALEYTQAKKTMIVFDQNYLTADGAKLIADIAVISGQIGKPRRGIIELKPKNNSQGLVDMGINRPSDDLVNAIDKKSLKGLIIFGEDVEGVNLENLEFLVVQDLYLTQTAKNADVVLPAVSYAESTGTFTSTERRIQNINSAIPALSGYMNWEVVNEMMYLLGKTDNYKSLEEITEEISKNINGYLGLNRLTESSYWPLGGSNVLYIEGFNTVDKKANLKLVSDAKLFEKRPTTDYVEKELDKVVSSMGEISEVLKK